MSFGKSRAKLQGEDQVKVTFADVAGVEEAKEEVAELVEFPAQPGQVPEAGRAHSARRIDGRLTGYR